jgi:hypothetical protein
VKFMLWRCVTYYLFHGNHSPDKLTCFCFHGYLTELCWCTDALKS